MEITPHVVDVAAHVSFGVAGLAVGLAPLFSRKGGTLHRRAGRVFVAFAIVVLATAIIADILFPQPFALIAATLAATYNLAASLRSLRMKESGPGGLDVILSLAALAMCAGLFGVMSAPGTKAFSPVVGYSTIGYVSALCVYDISRMFWRRAWRKWVRPIDHGVKMTAVFFGMMSAGLGNLFPAFQPWSAVVPIFAGNLLTLAFIADYFFLRPKAYAAPAAS